MSTLTVVALASCFMVVLAKCPCQKILRKKIYSCSDGSLTSIPDCVHPDISMISIETPSIPLVTQSIRRYTHLEVIVISHFSNPQVAKNFLTGLTNLTDFRIYNTSLDYVDGDWFLHAPNITAMNLNNNKIPSLAADTFRSLQKLQVVDLSNNALTTLPPTLFQGSALLSLGLDGNPWHCDCELATFMHWARDHRVRVGDSATCLHPEELRGVALNNLTTIVACRN